MISFNPLRFSQYARDLARAIEEMSLADIKARLPTIPGIDNLTMRPGPNGTELYRIGDREIEIPAGNAARRNRVQYLATGFQPAGTNMDDKTATPLPAVEIVPAAALPVIAGFQPGLIKARIEAIKQKAAERRAISMSKLDASAAKLETVDAAIEQYADKLDKQADAELQEFAEHTNGGPT